MTLYMISANLMSALGQKRTLLAADHTTYYASKGSNALWKNSRLFAISGRSGSLSEFAEQQLLTLHFIRFLQ